MKTATTLFGRIICENDSNGESDQDKNEDIELINNTNKNQEHERLFQRLYTNIEHSTNSTPTQLETFVDDRSHVTQFHTVVKQEMKL